MFLKVRSRNHSANLLRNQIEVTRPTVYRLGSFTPTNKVFKHCKHPELIREINTVEACKTSNDKYLMKHAFDEHNVKTAQWWTFDNTDEFNENYPLIIKHIHSSKGKGIYYIQNAEEMTEFINSHNSNLNNYIIEKYHKYVREYRLHVDKFGCFHANRKMLKNDATERWHRHHINTVWIREDNEMFDKPVNWDEIVAECQKAIAAVGLEIGCVDVKVQSNKQEHPDFIILETNSAPALGEESAPKYINELKKIVSNEN